MTNGSGSRVRQSGSGRPVDVVVLLGGPSAEHDV